MVEEGRGRRAKKNRWEGQEQSEAPKRGRGMAAPGSEAMAEAQRCSWGGPSLRQISTGLVRVLR
jgi:hypothetical protein